MDCSYCEESLLTEALFCHGCGKRIPVIVIAFENAGDGPDAINESRTTAAVMCASNAGGNRSADPPPPELSRGIAISSAANDPVTLSPGDDGRIGVMTALAAYVGPKWQSHYRTCFEGLLAATLDGTKHRWTWNWSACIFPGWFLYRRLYTAFVGFVVLESFVAALAVPIPPLIVVPMLVRGYVGDRLLFRKAMFTLPLDAEVDFVSLQRAGKPHKWVLWVPIVIAAIGFVAAITIPATLR
jgi:hypothetical protein